jgi:16S rRNA (uracil1498-N3)-methyltransferase
VTIRRLYAPDLPEKGGIVTLGDAAARHARVLRLRPGDAVELFDGVGHAAPARIESVGDVVVCEASPAEATREPSTRVVLLLAIPKGSKLDDSVRMATELGADQIALMQAERSVPRWDKARARSRIDRLTRIAAEAAAQCERTDVPLILGPRSCAEWLEALPADACRVVFGARAEGAFTLGETPEQVWCAIGPEGGFSDDELLAFKAAGFRSASLGRSVLRVDTAVSAALSVVQDRLASRQAR